MLLTGLRGVGKTVLLNEIERLAGAEGYRTVSIEAHEDKRLGPRPYRTPRATPAFSLRTMRCPKYSGSPRVTPTFCKSGGTRPGIWRRPARSHGRS